MSSDWVSIRVTGLRSRVCIWHWQICSRRGHARSQYKKSQGGPRGERKIVILEPDPPSGSTLQDIVILLTWPRREQMLPVPDTDPRAAGPVTRIRTQSLDMWRCYWNGEPIRHTNLSMRIAVTYARLRKSPMAQPRILALYHSQHIEPEKCNSINQSHRELEKYDSRLQQKAACLRRVLTRRARKQRLKAEG